MLCSCANLSCKKQYWISLNVYNYVSDSLMVGVIYSSKLSQKTIINEIFEYLGFQLFELCSFIAG